MIEAPGLYARFSPPGPKARAWLASTAEVSFLIGPVGSAKTTTGCMKGMQVTELQHPSTKDGVRKALVLATRQNYRRMEDTLIASFRTMFPECLTREGKQINGVYETDANGLLQHTIRWSGHRGPCELTTLFRAFGDLDIISFIRGFQPTSWYLSEADEQPEGSFGLMIQRAGRAYLDERPDPSVAPPVAYTKVYGDLNAPDEDSHFTRDVLENKDCPFEVIWQPSGFDAQAENLQNLRRIDANYYEKMAGNMEPWAVNRFIRNKIGMSRHGAPVFVEYATDCEIDNLQAEPKTRLVIGVDQGNRPAAIVTQKDRMARLLCLAEAVPPPDEITNGVVFGEAVADMLLADFRPWCVEGGFVFSFDPAAKARDNDERRWYQQFIIGAMKKLKTAPYILPHTNRLDPRLSSVRQFMTKRAREGGPAFLISKERCPQLRRALMSGYRLMKKKSLTGKVEYALEKNQHSDPGDALTYAAMIHSGIALAPEEEFGGDAAYDFSPAPDRSSAPDLILFDA